MSSSISTCPHCAQQVSISSGLEAETLVRCPICEAEFPLRLALVNAVEAPPELVPVARVTEALRDTAVQLATPPQTAGAKGKEAEAQGTAPPSISPERADPAPAGRPVDTAALVRALDEEQGPSHEIYGLAGHSAGVEASAIPDVTHAQAAALWRSRQKPVSSLGSVGKGVAIVVGGFLGIAVAYFFLSIISPRKFDFLHLWGRPRQQNAVTPKSDRDDTAFPDLDKNRSSGPTR